MILVNTANQIEGFKNTLAREAGAYGVTLSTEALAGLVRYYQLLSAWNSRVHLVAPCTAEEFATRHVLESLTLLKHLPDAASLAEVGAGAGLPILPCLIVRPDLRGILIEAAQKKAVFLREALKTTGTATRATVINERFEKVDPPRVDFVSCRALDRFDEMLLHLVAWAPPQATLLLFGGKRLGPRISDAGFSVSEELMPNSKNRFLFVVRKL